MPPHHYDALIVGARCAGAATAMLLARRGACVLIIDRAHPGDDTLSTHALMRGGVMHLARWGLLDRVAASGAPPVRRTSFIYDGAALSFDLKPEHGIGALYAPRRTVLDPLLATAAVEAGADLRYRTRLVALKFAPAGRVRGAVLAGSDGQVEVSADIVIGADGIGSTVAEMVGAEVTHTARNAAIALYCHVGGVEDIGYQWAFTERSSAGAIPTNDGAHSVFVGFSRTRRVEVLADGPRAAFDRLLGQNMPWLSDRVTRQDVRLKVFGGVQGYLRRPTGPGWALVGDAANFKDPATAHGISDAFRDAELLARAVGAGAESALADYWALRDALSLPLMRVTDRIAGCDWSLDELRALHVELSQAMETDVSVMSLLVPRRQAPMAA